MTTEAAAGKSETSKHDTSKPKASKILFIYDSFRGLELANRLLDVGHDVAAFLPEFGTQLSTGKLTRVTDLKAALRETKYIVMLLMGPHIAEDVLLEKNGVLQYAQEGTYIIDLSVSTPRFAREMNALASVHDCYYLDSPLSDDIASSGDKNSCILVGGETDTRADVMWILEGFGLQILETGLPGTGAAAKIAIIATQASILLGVTECLAYAHDSNMDNDALLKLIEFNPQHSVSELALAKMMLSEDYYLGYPLAQFYAELTVAMDAAEELNLAMPTIETAHQLFELLMMIGAGDRAVQALTLIFSEEQQCREQGLDWDLAQRFMDVYEPHGEWENTSTDDFEDGFDDFGHSGYDCGGSCTDSGCNHDHGHN